MTQGTSSQNSLIMAVTSCDLVIKLVRIKGQQDAHTICQFVSSLGRMASRNLETKRVGINLLASYETETNPKQKCSRHCISCLFENVGAIVFCCCVLQILDQTSTEMDTEPDIEITRHTVQNKSLTPGITLH